jgi:hypothetical protein
LSFLDLPGQADEPSRSLESANNTDKLRGAALEDDRDAENEHV